MNNALFLILGFRPEIWSQMTEATNEDERDPTRRMDQVFR